MRTFEVQKRCVADMGELAVVENDVDGERAS